MHIHTRTLLSIAAAMLLVLAAASAARADVLHVPDDFSTIQAAVNAASPGDTIQVSRGTYNENVVITKSGLRLRAEDDERAVLDGTGIGGVGILVQGTATNPVREVEIMGFLVQSYFRAIQLEHAEHCRVNGNETRDNGGEHSDLPEANNGIVLKAASFNRVNENFAHHNGHNGITLVNGSSGNILEENRIEDNGAGTGAAQIGCGVQLVSGANANNHIVENQVLRNHWGIQLQGSNVTGNLVAENHSTDNGRAGIAAIVGAHGNFIIENDAQGNGTLNRAPSFGFDLFDTSSPLANTWLDNKGTANF